MSLSGYASRNDSQNPDSGSEARFNRNEEPMEERNNTVDSDERVVSNENQNQNESNNNNNVNIIMGTGSNSIISKKKSVDSLRKATSKESNNNTQNKENSYKQEEREDIADSQIIISEAN